MATAAQRAPTVRRGRGRGRNQCRTRCRSACRPPAGRACARRVSPRPAPAPTPAARGVMPTIGGGRCHTVRAGAAHAAGSYRPPGQGAGAPRSMNSHPVHSRTGGVRARRMHSERRAAHSGVLPHRRATCCLRHVGAVFAARALGRALHEARPPGLVPRGAAAAARPMRFGPRGGGPLEIEWPRARPPPPAAPVAERGADPAYGVSTRHPARIASGVAPEGAAGPAVAGAGTAPVAVAPRLGYARAGSGRRNA